MSQKPVLRLSQLDTWHKQSSCRERPVLLCVRAERRARPHCLLSGQNAALFHRCATKSVASADPNRCDADDAAPQHSDGSFAATPPRAARAARRHRDAQFPGMPGARRPPRPIFKTASTWAARSAKLAVEEIWKEALRLREEAPYKKP